MGFSYFYTFALYTYILTVMKQVYYTTFLLLAFCNGFAQHDAVSRGLGNNTTAIVNEYSIFNNFAASVYHEYNTAVTTTEMQHTIQKMAVQQAGIGIHKKNRTFGATLYHTGFSAFQHSRLGVFYGMALNEQIAMALQLNIHHFLEPEGYGSGIGISPDVSMIYRFNKTFSIGVVANNILRLSHPFASEPLTERLAIGAAWVFSETLTFSSDFEKTMSDPLSVGVGIEWAIMKSVYIRTGLRQMPRLNAIGIGYKTSRTLVDVAMSYIPLLGATPSVSLSHSW